MRGILPRELRRKHCYHKTREKVQTLGVVLGLAWVLTGCRDTAQRRSGPDTALADTLKTLIATAYDFSRPGAVERMSALYPDSGQVISASGGQLLTTSDSVKKGIATFWENVGRNMRNPHFQWHSVYVERLGPDAAVLTGTWSIPHIAPDHQPHTIAGAWTAVFRRMNGKWKIVQEHLSS